MRTVLFSTIIILSALSLPACSTTEQLKTEIPNNVEQSITVTPTDKVEIDVDDTQLLNELNTLEDLDIESQFSQLESEIE